MFDHHILILVVVVMEGLGDRTGNKLWGHLGSSETSDNSQGNFVGPLWPPLRDSVEEEGDPGPLVVAGRGWSSSSPTGAEARIKVVGV